MVKIFIDPGHGGKDPGAVGNGLQEKDLTLKISLKIRDILQKEYSNVDVRLSRTTDVYLSLAERVRLTNAWGADLLLSIHINATPSGYGYEDYIYSGGVSATSVKVQNAINAEVVKATGWRNRGKLRKNLQVLRDSKMAALLTESGFIDNPTDSKLLKDDAFLNKVARGHVNGIAKALNLSRKSNASNGWIKSGTNWTFNQNGKLATGWLQDKNKWYYLNASGIMQVGWVSVGGKWYYLNANGDMAIGWKKVGGEWYLLDSSGAMLTGWQQVNGKWYILAEKGHMYEFDKNGALIE